MSTFADRCVELRQSLARSGRRMSQAELGKLAGVSKAAVSNWERGLTTPDRQAAETMHNNGIDIAWLINGTTPGQPVNADRADQYISISPRLLSALGALSRDQLEALTDFLETIVPRETVVNIDPPMPPHRSPPKTIKESRR